jgi:hypothetical protein
MLVAGTAILLVPGEPLPSRVAWFGAALASLASLAPVWRSIDDEPGFAPWYVRTATILFTALMLRGRPAQAWFGAALSYVFLVTWGLAAGAPFGHWGGIILRQLATLVALQAFAFLMVRLKRRTAAYRAEERARIEATERRSAALRERNAELAAIRVLVDPSLRRIAGGETSDDLKDEAALVAAELRDRLRGRRLTTRNVPDAVRRARRRGMDVVLLDDFHEIPGSAGDLDPAALAAGLGWLAERIDAAHGPRATARLSRDGEGRPRLSLVSGHHSEAFEEHGV